MYIQITYTYYSDCIVIILYRAFKIIEDEKKRQSLKNIVVSVTSVLQAEGVTGGTLTAAQRHCFN